MFKHRFYYVNGSKGGVGKSLVANSLAFNLIEQGKVVKIIETDDTNPDVGRVYKKSVPVVEIPLSDDSKSWGEFLNTLDNLASEADGQIHVVVNGAARDNKTIENNGDLLNGVFEEGLNYEFTTLWVMNDSTDSVDLLKSYLKVVNVGTLFTLRNLHFGSKEDFVTFNEAYPGFKKRLNGVYDFPDLESNIASQIHRDRILLSDVEKTLEIGSRMLFKRWLNGTRKIFSDMNEVLSQLENVNRRRVCKINCVFQKMPRYYQGLIKKLHSLFYRLTEEDINLAKLEQEYELPEEIDENIPRKSAPQSLFDKYRKISDAELTKEQRLRMANLFDAFGMEDVIYYEHMILALEYYLWLNTKEIREHASIILSDRFLDNIEVQCKDAIRRVTENMEEEISSAGSLTQQLFELTNDTLPSVNKAIQDFEAVPSRIESRLSECLVTVVEKQLEAKKREVQWFESIARNSVFIFGFGFFGIFFFVAGLLSYGAGFPPWIAGILGEEKGLGMIASVAFGLPMSWTLWIGGGFLSLLWLYEHRKLRLINELVAFHMMSYVIGGVIVFLLMWWLL